MKVFDKVLGLMKKQQINGHAQANIENRNSLLKAKIELENIFINRKEIGIEDAEILSVNKVGRKTLH